MIAFFQWGWGADFAYVVLAYGIIQALDGNVLVPLLFSEAVNLHPVAIIVAVLVFGGVWGLWGVFFAIPLATLVKAVLNAWPTAQKQQVA
jgi:putative permease